jgi:hypothetical protein
MDKSFISDINPETQRGEWKVAHFGMLSSSLIHKICGKDGLGKGAITYIRKKVGEFITQMPEKDDEILTEAIAWGNMNEPYAVKQLQRMYPKMKIRTQLFLVDPSQNCCSTLDVGEITYETETEIEIIPTEIKCPQAYDKYIELLECEKPEDVKEVRPDAYWQLTDQILFTDAVQGKLFIYNPLFKKCPYKEIPFNVFENRKPTILFEDLKILKIRKQLAEKEFNRIRDILLKN